MTGLELLSRLASLPPEALSLPVTSEDLETYLNELTEVEVREGSVRSIELDFGKRA